MNENATIQRVFDDHATVGSGHVPYIHANLLLKALRELGLTPHDDLLETLLSDCPDGVVEYPAFLEMHSRLEKEVITPEQIRLALQAFDPTHSGQIVIDQLKEAILGSGDMLSPTELTLLLGSVGDGVGVEKLSEIIVEKHRSAKAPCGGGHITRTVVPEAEEVSFAREQVAVLRAKRRDEAVQRREGLPSRTADLAELSQDWLRGSHVRFLSYEGPGEGADRLKEISNVFSDVDASHCASLGFHAVRFRRSDDAFSTRLVLCEADFSVADVRRLIAEALSLAINNIVFTVALGQPQAHYVLSGQPLTRGGGSFLSQLLALYTQVTGDDSPAELPEVLVYRQPDVVQHRGTSLCTPMSDVVLEEALEGGKVVLKRTLGVVPADGSEGSWLVFADRLERKGLVRNPESFLRAEGGVSVEVRVASLQIPRAKKPVLVLKVTSSASIAKGFPFRCGVVVDTSQMGLETTGQPFALYQWKGGDRPHAFNGFSCSASPVMMQNTGTSVMRVIVELHQDGLYYISDAEIEFLLDEANLDGRINRQYEDDGKTKVTGGRQYIRPWGWTRKGTQMRPWKIEVSPASVYHGSELDIVDTFFAAPPRRSQSGRKSAASMRVSHRNTEHPRLDWRPADTPAHSYHQFRDDNTVSDALFFSPSLQFSVFRPFFQYYSLISSCDVPQVSEGYELYEWVTVPQVSRTTPLVRLCTTVYVDSDPSEDVAHPFSHVLPTVDTGFKGKRDMDVRCPLSRCRPVGLLLKRFSEPPERKLLETFGAWGESTKDFSFGPNVHVCVRDAVTSKWQRGVITEGEGSDIKVRVGSTTKTYNFVRPDFDRDVVCSQSASPPRERGMSGLGSVVYRSEPLGGSGPLKAESILTRGVTSDGDEGPEDHDTPISAGPKTPEKVRSEGGGGGGGGDSATHAPYGEGNAEVVQKSTPQEGKTPLEDNAPTRGAIAPTAASPPNPTPKRKETKKEDGCCVIL